MDGSGPRESRPLYNLENEYKQLPRERRVVGVRRVPRELAAKPVYSVCNIGTDLIVVSTIIWQMQSTNERSTTHACIQRGHNVIRRRINHSISNAPPFLVRMLILSLAVCMH